MPRPLPAELPPSALSQLPLRAWARRLQSGHVVLRGQLRAPVECGDVIVAPGRVEVRFRFVGGSAARIVAMEVGELVWLDDAAHLHLVALLAQLDDTEVTARALPAGDISVRLGLGVAVVVPAGIELTVETATRGPAASPHLSRPLDMRFGGEGLKLSHEARWLSRLAEVRLGGASLDPDGRVHLEGQGGRLSEFAVLGPLQKASYHLSNVVLRSPLIRAFLKR